MDNRLLSAVTRTEPRPVVEMLWSRTRDLNDARRSSTETKQSAVGTYYLLALFSVAMGKDWIYDAEPSKR